MVLILPIIAMAIVGTGLWNFFESRDAFYQYTYDHIQLVLNETVANELTRRNLLLKRANMDQIKSFVNAYKKEAITSIKERMRSENGTFVIFDRRTNNLLISPAMFDPQNFTSLREETLKKKGNDQISAKGDIKIKKMQYFYVADDFAPWDWVVVYLIEGTPVQRSIVAGFWRTTFWIFLFVCVGITSMFWLLKKFLIQRVLHLKQGAALIGQGDLTYRFDIRDPKDELDDLALAFNRMADAIEHRETRQKKMNSELLKKNEELEQFTYIASHDLQEPLRKLSAFSGLLKKDVGENLNSRAEKDLEYIIDASQRMQALIQDLLSFSRAGRIARASKKIDLNKFIQEVKASFKEEIEQSGADFKTVDFPTVYADPVLLKQVFQNLIHNAFKFNNKKKPIVEITCTEKNGQTIFGVKDNGIGIKPEYMEQIFIPFKRLHGRYEYPGTGIGLSICKKIVEQHEGAIWVESKLNEYSHFKFTLNVKEN
jgi:signal transduction histidine kinase